MATDRATNFGGRFEYLEATMTHWPDLLRSLHRSTAGPFAACMNGSAVMPLSFSELADYATEKENENVLSLLENWARDHGLSDSWLLDAAVQSLGISCRGRFNGRWKYEPKELNTPTFNPVFDALWIPEMATWPDFKADVDRAYRTQLKQYRNTVARLWGADIKTIGIQAIWTVLWQRGKSAGQIRLWEFRTNGRRVSEANIVERVNEFAESIGLTLRASKHSLKK